VREEFTHAWNNNKLINLAKQGKKRNLPGRCKPRMMACGCWLKRNYLLCFFLSCATACSPLRFCLCSSPLFILWFLLLFLFSSPSSGFFTCSPSHPLSLLRREGWCSYGYCMLTVHRWTVTVGNGCVLVQDIEKSSLFGMWSKAPKVVEAYGLDGLKRSC